MHPEQRSAPFKISLGVKCACKSFFFFFDTNSVVRQTFGGNVASAAQNSAAFMPCIGMESDSLLQNIYSLMLNFHKAASVEVTPCLVVQCRSPT